jgi:hypothetical protein
MCLALVKYKSKMFKAVCLAFCLISCVLSSSSSSHLKSSATRRRQNRHPLASIEPESSSMPTWLKTKSFKQSSEDWNLSALWFNQHSSKPIGNSIRLSNIKHADQLWSHVTPNQFMSVQRVNLNIFRPGFDSDLGNYVDHPKGFILSYKVDFPVAVLAKKPSKLSRNEAKRLSSVLEFDPIRQFDPLIIASLLSTQGFPSEIIGFIFKRQYSFTFIQIVCDGSVSSPHKAQVPISNLFKSVIPAFTIKKPIIYKLASYSSRVNGSPLKPKASESFKIEFLNEDDDSSSLGTPAPLEDCEEETEDFEEETEDVDEMSSEFETELIYSSDFSDELASYCGLDSLSLKSSSNDGIISEEAVINAILSAPEHIFEIYSFAKLKLIIYIFISKMKVAENQQMISNSP